MSQLQNILDQVADLQRDGLIDEAAKLLEPHLGPESPPQLSVRLADLRRRQERYPEAIELYRDAAIAYGREGQLTHALAINKLLRLLAPKAPSVMPRIAQGHLEHLRSSGKAWGLVADVLKEMDSAAFVALLEQADAHTYLPGEIIAQGSDVESGTFVVVRGQVRISSHNREGIPVEEAILSPGHFFDDWSLNHADRISWAESVTEVDCLLFQVDTVDSIAERHPKIAKTLKIARERRGLEALLALQPTLGALDGPTRQLIPRMMEEVSLEPDAMVFREGDSSEHLYLIQRGRVEVFTEGQDDERLSLAILGPGELFGEGAALNGVPRSASVKAKTRVVLHRLSREDILALIAPHPEVVEDLKGVFRERVTDTLERLDEDKVI